MKLCLRFSLFMVLLTLFGCKTATIDKVAAGVEDNNSNGGLSSEPKTNVTPPKNVTNQQEAVFKISVDGTVIGTGFAIRHNNVRIKNYSVIITAAHSLAGVIYDASSSIAVIDSKGKSITVSRHILDSPLDVAVLMVKGNLPSLESGATPSVEAECKSYNFSYLPAMSKNPIILSKGYIENIDKNDIWAYLLPFEKGGSGSPLLCSQLVVGMINSKALNIDKNSSGVVHAVNIYDIIEFINRIK